MRGPARCQAAGRAGTGRSGWAGSRGRAPWEEESGGRGPTGDARRAAARTREAYERLAPVWSSTTDDGPINGRFERPALRSLVPMPLTAPPSSTPAAARGQQCEWLLSQGADVVGIDLSPAMEAEARARCGGGTSLAADLAVPWFTVYRLRLLGGPG